MIFAPSATLRFYDRLISTDTGIRGIGPVIAPLVLVLVVHIGETSTGKGTFKLESVGEPYVE